MTGGHGASVRISSGAGSAGVPEEKPSATFARRIDVRSWRTQRPSSLTDTRETFERRGSHRRLNSRRVGRWRHRGSRDVRCPHGLHIPRGHKRTDQRVKRTPRRLREYQRASQQTVGFFTHDEAGAGLSARVSAVGWWRAIDRGIRHVGILADI